MSVIGRVIDVVIAFPFLVLVIAIVAMLGPGLVNLYIAISAVSWVLYARIVRGETLAIRRREYILAAESLGYGASAHHAAPHPAERPGAGVRLRHERFRPRPAARRDA